MKILHPGGPSSKDTDSTFEVSASTSESTTTSVLHSAVLLRVDELGVDGGGDAGKTSEVDRGVLDDAV